MLSSLPKLADKAFILGFFMPVLLFFAGALVLFGDRESVKKVLETAMGKEPLLDKLVIPVFVVWTAAVLVMLANHSLIRMLEGYSWPVSKFRFLENAQRRELDDRTKVQKEREKRGKELAALYDTASKQCDAEKIKQVGDELAEARKVFDKEALDLSASFPPAEWLVPTRFGNTIRAFETYSNIVYGADSIPIWPRLATVIPNDFQQALEDARAQVNFLVNIFFFAIVLAVISLVRIVAELQSPELYQHGIAFAVGPGFGEVQLRLIIAVLGFAAIAWGAYTVSILRARAWGELVKAAFDCYLPDLAKRLGYQLPRSGDDRRLFWTAVNRQALYMITFEPAKWPLATPNVEPPTAAATPHEENEGNNNSE